MAATLTSPPPTEQSAAHSADEAWWWDGSRWQPASTEITVGHDLRRRLWPLALPLHLTPGWSGLLVLLAAAPVLWVIAAIAESVHQPWALRLFFISFVAPLLALPLLLLRFALGFGITEYRHDLTARTLWRSSGHAQPAGEEITIAGWRLRPRAGSAAIRKTLSAMPWAQVDHGAAGAVVYAIRDDAGKPVYELTSGSFLRSIALWGIAVAAVAWTVAVSAVLLNGISSLESSDERTVLAAQGRIDALAAATPCETGAVPSIACFVLTSGAVNDVRDVREPDYVCQVDVAVGDQVTTYDVITPCSRLPATGTDVRVRSWDGKVVDLSYADQRFDTVDSPDVAYGKAKGSLDAAAGFAWAWTLAPIAYAILIGAGYLAWRLGTARRQARYSNRYSRPPRVRR